MTAIVARDLLVVRGGRTILDGVSLGVPWGSVTGFLGVNGAGKTTTMRCLLGLLGSGGEVRIAGAEPRRIANPARVVGVAFDELLADPAHSPRMHLEQLAAAACVGPGRVTALLAEVGLDEVGAGGAGRGDGRRRAAISTLSLGMRKRLAIAAALVGAPPLLLLDEPFDGLDPTGRRWLRDLLRTHADRGGAVLLSAHGLDEIAPIVDRVVVLDGGRVRFEGATAAFLARRSSLVVVRALDPFALRAAAEAVGASVIRAEGELLHLSGVSAPTVARLALDLGILVVELTTTTPSLGDAFVAEIGTE